MDGDSVDIEYECRVLEIDVDSFMKLLEDNGAIKKGEYFQKRNVYDFKPVDPNKWIRLRSNGDVVTLTLKKLEDRNSIEGTKELEIEVSSFEQTDAILNELGYHSRTYQENRRISYILDDVEIDIDTWPLIPTYAELEGKNREDIEKLIEKLNLDRNKITTYDVTSIYNEIYNIDVMKIKSLKFNWVSVYSLIFLLFKIINPIKN